MKFGEVQAFSVVDSSTKITATAPPGVSTRPGERQREWDAQRARPTVSLFVRRANRDRHQPNRRAPGGRDDDRDQGDEFHRLGFGRPHRPGHRTFVFVSPTTLTAVTPPVPTGAAAHVRVTTGSGQSPEGPEDVFTYTSGPIVDAVNPDNGPTTGASIVVITGKNFTAPLSLTFGGIAATSFNINSATQITVLSPPNSTPGAVDSPGWRKAPM